MDNQDNNVNDTDSVADEMSDEQMNNHHIEDTDQNPDDESVTGEPVKSGRGLAFFSLFVALLALVTAGWLYYHTEFQNQEPSATEPLTPVASQDALEKLQGRVSQLEQKQEQHAQAIKQNKQNLSQLQQNLQQQPDQVFDPAPLEQQINQLQQQLTALKNQPQQQQTIEPRAQSHLAALARAQSIDALQTVQLLLHQQHLPQAVKVLKQWRNNEHLPLAVQTRMQQLITTLSNLESPDINHLRQQLVTVQNDVEALTLTTESADSQEPAWYERLITVRKIKPEQQNINSADLQQLKANVGRAIEQATLALALKQPDLWQAALKQAQNSLALQQLNTETIQQQLQQLSQQNILVQVPENLGIPALIQQLEGITE